MKTSLVFIVFMKEVIIFYLHHYIKKLDFVKAGFANITKALLGILFHIVHLFICPVRLKNLAIFSGQVYYSRHLLHYLFSEILNVFLHQ